MPEPLIRLSETGNFLIFNLCVRYADVELDLDPEAAYARIKVDGKSFNLKRDQQFERSIFEQVTSMHPGFNPKTALDYYFLPGDKVMENGWFFDFYENCQQQGIQVEGLETLKKIRYKPIRPNISYHLSSGINWFEIDLELRYGEEIVPFNNVKRAIEQEKEFVKLKDGSLGLLPKNWLDKWILAVEMGKIAGGKLKLPKTHFLLVEKLFREADKKQKLPEEVEAVREMVQSFNKIKMVKIPKGIQATLRDYQQSGFSWMVFLAKMQWGGCLADDMGLGKTLQMLTFLWWLKQQKRRKVQFLVICPTTLLFNWQDEIKKFCPGLTFFVHWGTQRPSTTEEWQQVDMILTSYGTMTNDVLLFQSHKFDCVVLDESQAIKNPNSLRYKAVRLLDADHRFALSGTPIENNVMELFSQMQFLNPGSLGSVHHFRSNFAKLIEEEENTEVTEILRSLIKPFIFRRTKEQVAKELPPKTEMVLYCEMGVEQAELYEQQRKIVRKELFDKISDLGLGQSSMHVLAGITRLRQIANSPALVRGFEQMQVSVKADELLRYIKEKTGKHKILVFSQFVKMLAVIRTRLEQESIPFSYLDGQTRDREAAVRYFREEKSCRVFLISLKAGGVGLTLTEADYVFMVDPWWNPAVERQAIDRAHRIGQEKQVFAYRMICKNTIEEKIMQLQQRKKQLAEDLIVSEKGFVKNLKKEDLEQLFG